MAMKVNHVSSDGQRAHLNLIGDLDMLGGATARKRLAAEIQAGRVDLTVNLDGVGFLDSAGLAALISALRLARDRGGDVQVETSNQRIRRVLEVTALARVFKLRSTAEVAA